MTYMDMFPMQIITCTKKMLSSTLEQSLDSPAPVFGQAITMTLTDSFQLFLAPPLSRGLKLPCFSAIVAHFCLFSCSCHWAQSELCFCLGCLALRCKKSYLLTMTQVGLHPSACAWLSQSGTPLSTRHCPCRNLVSICRLCPE